MLRSLVPRAGPGPGFLARFLRVLGSFIREAQPVRTKMDTHLYRSLIIDGHKHGRKANEIHDYLVQGYGQDAPSLSTVRYWIRRAKCGAEGPASAPKPGRPVSVVDQQLIDRIAKTIENDRKISLSTLALNFHVSYGTIFKIVHDQLGLVKKYAKWVPHKLSDAQKAARVEICTSFLKRFGGDFAATKSRLITSDETWVMLDTPESKERSREWRKPDEPAPKRERLKPRGEKVMMTVWWDARGPIFIDFWKKSDQISFNADYYVGQIEEFRKQLPVRRRGILSAGPLIWVDNAPIHMASISRAAFERSGLELLKMPPYSPDIAPCDYYLFRNLKSWLQGRKFSSREEVEEQLLAWFSSKPTQYYEKGIEQLTTRMKRVIELGGDYAE